MTFSRQYFRGHLFAGSVQCFVQEEQRAYNNREQCRDHFYAIMREGASAHTVFGWVSSGSEGEGYRKMKEGVKHFLQILLVENYPWFAGK